MADTVTVFNGNTGGTNYVVASDDIGGNQHQRIKLIHGIDGVNDGDVAKTNPLPVYAPSVVSTNNSTTSVLAGAAVFTGTSDLVKDYAVIVVSAFSSHASATDGLSIQQSSNGTNWDITDTYTVAAGNGFTYSMQPSASYFRIVYTNGGTLQTSFRLQVVYHYVNTKPSSQRPSDAYTAEVDTEQVSGFNMLFNGTGWDRVRGDITNGVDVDVTRLPALVAGSAIVGKFGIDQTTPGTTNAVAITGTPATTLGGVTEDAALSGNALRQGIRAHTTVPTAMSTDNDIVTPWGDLSGAMAVIPQPRSAANILTPTVSTTPAYTAGDQVGGIITIPAALASGRPGQIIGATLLDKGKQNAILELWIFKVSPTLVGSDNAAFDITDANMVTAKPVCIIDFATANYAATATNSTCCGVVRGTPGGNYVTSGSANLFGIFVSRGTPTYQSASDLVVEITVNQF